METANVTVGCSFIIKSMDILPRTVASVQPFVDELFVLLDDRASPEVVDFLECEGIRYDPYRWCDDFSDAHNRAHDGLSTDWGFALDGDETLELKNGPLLRSLAAQGEAEGLDGWITHRWHWCDLAMTERFVHPTENWGNNPLVRLRRKGWKFTGRVHPRFSPSYRVRETPDGAPVIHHFNTAIKTPEDWETTRAWYQRLWEMDSAGI